MNRPADASFDPRALDPRARLLLRTLISRYIRDGEPVGSQTLARHAGLDVSSATIRSILSELEDVGLLSAPHTSAGRIPTSQGYRVFVDSLLQIQPLADGEVSRLRSELAPGAGTQSLLGSASELVSANSLYSPSELSGLSRSEPAGTPVPLIRRPPAPRRERRRRVALCRRAWRRPWWCASS